MIIVLGGTSGLGLEMAWLLRAQGKRVVVVGKDHLREEHGEGFSLDLLDETSAMWASGELDRLSEEERVEGFVWSAGYGWRGAFADQPGAKDMAEVNFSSALPFVQWAWRKMAEQTEPSNLVVLGSTSSVKPRADEAVYVATKHAQAGLARALGLEAEASELLVRVALFLPGGVKTKFWEGREKPEEYAIFNEPAKVAAEIVRFVGQQKVPFIEMSLPKGTLT